MSSGWKVGVILSGICLLGCSGPGHSTASEPNYGAGPPIPGLQVHRSLAAALDGNIGGYLEFVPADYATSNHTYPLLLFCHGSSESGDGSNDMVGNVANRGVPMLLRDGGFPAQFTVKGETYSFIVESPQFQNWPSPSNLVALMDHLKSRDLHFDPTRVYLTGLSMGGALAWTGACSPELLPMIAAVVPISGAETFTEARAQVIAEAGLPVWALHNDGDPMVSSSLTRDWVDAINRHNPAIPARETLFHNEIHDAWTLAYNPGCRETIEGISMNLYEWLLSYRKP